MRTGAGVKALLEEVEPPEDEVPEWEKVELDVWHWRDPLLQPMQLVQRTRELERTYRAVALLDDGMRVVQLASESHGS